MYSIYKQLHPPTGVEESLFCNFFNNKEKCLVTTCVNQIHVYRLNSEMSDHTNQGKDFEKSTDNKSKCKLECLASFTLFGNIQSIASAQLPGASRDSLIVCFMEAKIAIVEYDPEIHDLKTISLHFYEEYEMKDGFVNHLASQPIVRVDPENRCAAILVYGSRLVILPFKRDSAADIDEDLKGSLITSYTIDTRLLDEHIVNIADMQFLHGYYEPTLFILYEPLPTWAGRIAVRKDSYSIVALSLNIHEKVNPVIWSHSGLPYDCLNVYPVSKPIGGVIVTAVNTLMYLNQSVPPYGVSLNSHTNYSTDFLLKQQEGVVIELDCSRACFIDADKMVISLKGGDLYVLTLVVDSMRAVRCFNLDRAASSVLTTTITDCENGFLFLGSRLGNSMVLRYAEKMSENGLNDLITNSSEETLNETNEPFSKRKKTGTLGDWVSTDVSALDDLDELEVYGSSSAVEKTGSKVTTYSFEVCDSLLNIGPCSQMVMGEPAFLSEEFSQLDDPDLELVTTSGYSKNGALSVLQRSIRPQIVTTFELPGVVDMWTVVGSKESTNQETENKSDESKLEGSHALLVLSRADSSMILETGCEIKELDHSGFDSQSPTVYAGNVGDDRYIFQVSPRSVRLLDGVNQVQFIPIDIGSPIIHCSVADPYIAVMSAEGAVILLTLRLDPAGTPKLSILRPQFLPGSRVTTVCVYKDMSGMFTVSSEQNGLVAMSDTPASAKLSMDTSYNFSQTTSVEDEDELLYGESTVNDASLFSLDSNKRDDQSFFEKKSADSKATYWMVVAKDNGSLEIYSVPEFKLVFFVKDFSNGAKCISDGPEDFTMSNLSVEAPEITEILLVGLGNNEKRPFLMARSGLDLLIYEVFSYASSTSSHQHLKIKLAKIQHDLILHERQLKTKKRGGDETIEAMAARWDYTRMFRPFKDVTSYNGVFICGPYPHWVFVTSRGILRTHPMSIDGTVTCFSPFHNVNCPKGFLYFNSKSELRISVLPTHLSYDSSWPVRKVPLRLTPYRIIYHPDSKTYSLVTSTPEPCKKVARIVAEATTDKEFEEQERDDRFIYPMLDRFSVQLFSPVSWEAIPNTKVEFEEFERVTAIDHVFLISEGTVSGFKGHIAIGTTYSYNEEIGAKGRILIYDVIEVVPEPGQPLTRNKIKMEYSKSQSGPVTALSAVQGYLVTAIGQKIYIWQLKDNDLLGVAFIDTMIYIHKIETIKNLILACDVYKSVTLLRYQTDMKMLSVISRDIKALEVYSAAYVVDNTSLSFLVSDKEKNFIVYSYQPEFRESHGGQRLLRRADFNVGSHVNTFFRLRCKLSDPSTEKLAPPAIKKRHVNFFATLDGAIGYVLPLTEKVYRRLLMLQNALTNNLSHHAGLNPKAFRTVQHAYRQMTNPCRGVLDGDLIWKYLHLSHQERADLARRIGTSLLQLTDDIMEIERITAHF